jgi:hypothetical protein
MNFMKNARFPALGVALMLAGGGCHGAPISYQDYTTGNSNNDPPEVVNLESLLMELSGAVGLPLALSLIDALTQAQEAPRADWDDLSTTGSRARLLGILRGQLLDEAGGPLAGVTVTVRAATGYTTNPEKLSAVTMKSGPDGAYTIPMSTDNVWCVDFTAKGKQPMRRWFIVVVPGALKGLPADQREIIFVSPYETEARAAPLMMAAGN